MRGRPFLAKACWILCAALVSACSSPAPPPARTPSSASPVAAPAPGPEPKPAGPADVAIGELVLDAERTVRIKGVVSEVLGMRLVPPKVVFKVADQTGAVTVVINEQVQITEGTKMELVGKYGSFPSPMHSAPGEAPKESVFVVERFLDLP